MTVEARRPLQRLVMRCLFGFLIDEAQRLAARHDGALIRGVVFLALCQASRASRAAVSVRALAQSLDLPYETARRHVAELEALGLCERVGEGRRAPDAVLAAEATHPDTAASWNSLLAMLGDLKGLGLDLVQFERSAPPVGPAVAALTGALAPGAESRALIDAYMLRLIEIGIGPHGSVIDALVTVAMMDLNAELITHDPTLAWRYAANDTPPPDDLRRPATLAALTHRLNLPAETMRRRAERLVQLGRCERVGRGYRVKVEFLQDPDVLQAGLMCAQRTAQLLHQLRAAGIDVDAVPARRADQVA